MDCILLYLISPLMLASFHVAGLRGSERYRVHAQTVVLRKDFRCAAVESLGLLAQRRCQSSRSRVVRINDLSSFPGVIEY